MPTKGSDQYGQWNASTKVRADREFLGLRIHDPVKKANGTKSVHVPPRMRWNGSWNGCAVFLQTDNNTIIQGQPLKLAAGGNPSWQYPFERPVSLNGQGVSGCHGGSALSGLGGSIRKGELTNAQPIRHALKIEFYCHLYCYPGNNRKAGARNGYRWPATTRDNYASDHQARDSHGNPLVYSGTNPDLQMGSLLALKKDTDLRFITDIRVKKIAEALRDYGAYMVDDTAWNVYQFGVEAGAAWSDGSSEFDQQLLQVIVRLQVISNNQSHAIGGGGNPGTCLAPPFADGTPDGIAKNPNGNVTEPARCHRLIPVWNWHLLDIFFPPRQSIRN